MTKAFDGNAMRQARQGSSQFRVACVGSKTAKEYKST